MRALIATVALLALAAVAVVAAPANAPAYQEPDAGAVFKMMVGNGHGSAVHIGGGYALTAQHVVTNKTAVTYALDNGQTGDATVLWANAAHDVALIKMDDGHGVSVANLECRTPTIGEAVSLHGNPLILEHITTWGRVAGAATGLGPWAVVIPIDASMGMGMSGGGVFDGDGDLVGINVGMIAQPTGFASTAVGLSLVVPGDVLCGMLARGWS